MNCWHCDRPAQGVCRFCGRGVCRDHARSLPHIEALPQRRRGAEGTGGRQRPLLRDLPTQGRSSGDTPAQMTPRSAARKVARDMPLGL